MNRLLLSLCLATAVCVSATSVAALPTQDEELQQSTSTAPVAFIYVSGSPNGGPNEISAFAAAASGKLTPVSGSPFREDVTSMAVNGKHLFASTSNGVSVDSFAIETDGALRWTLSNNVVQHNPSDCGTSGPLFLDHTGASLYDLQTRSDCSNNSYQSFSVGSAGQLHLLGSSGPDSWLSSPASFLGDNVYAYSADCLGNLYWEVSGYKRSSNGLLSGIGIRTQLPAPKSGDFWCPSLTAADRTNHVAISLRAVNQNFNLDGAARIAAFTADSAGNLKTNNTLANMPQSAVGAIATLSMAPSSTLLAVGGSSGLQVFHFNGGNPLTHYTGLLTNDAIDQVYWDNASHLYAISNSANKLFVFNVTATSVHQAIGSPYTIGHPAHLAVLPKTPYR